MAKLGAVICEAIVVEYGRDELLRRLAHPFWFQSFGCVMGMDWHSSGITTSVVGALKRGLNPMSKDLGLHVWRAWRAFAQDAGRASRGRRTRRARRRRAGSGEQACGEGGQRRRSGRLRSLPARLHRRRRWSLGRGATGHERRQPYRAALSLALGRAVQLRRPAACGHRGRGAGQHRQSNRPARGPFARGAARPPANDRTGRRGAQIRCG